MGCFGTLFFFGKLLRTGHLVFTVRMLVMTFFLATFIKNTMSGMREQYNSTVKLLPKQKNPNMFL